MKVSRYLDLKIEPRNSARQAFSKLLAKTNSFREGDVWNFKSDFSYSFALKQDFDRLCTEKIFADGPFRETFGDGHGEPYNPYKQAWGILPNGIFVYTELDAIVQKSILDAVYKAEKAKT